MNLELILKEIKYRGKMHKLNVKIRYYENNFVCFLYGEMELNKIIGEDFDKLESLNILKNNIKGKFIIEEARKKEELYEGIYHNISYYMKEVNSTKGALINKLCKIEELLIKNEKIGSLYEFLVECKDKDISPIRITNMLQGYIDEFGGNTKLKNFAYNNIAEILRNI